MEDHIHILVDVHPTVAVASLVGKIKQDSSHWMKTKREFLGFECWGEGYYAVSIGTSEVDTCIEYIKSQEAHHSRRDLMEEMEDMANRNGLTWYQEDWT